MNSQSLDRYRDTGLLLLRIGVGAMFLAHGIPKLMGGEQQWAQIGGAMGNLGITFAPAFWGFMAGMAEAGGGALLMLGLLTRVAAAFMTFNMVVALFYHYNNGDPFMTWSHAAEAGIVFFSVMLIGAGRYSVDHALGARRSQAGHKRATEPAESTPMGPTPAVSA